MPGKLARAAVALLGLAVRPACGQYDDIDFESENNSWIARRDWR